VADPQTEAGQLLMDSWLLDDLSDEDVDNVRADIRVIEGQAAELERKRIRERAAAMHEAIHTGNGPSAFDGCNWQPCPAYRRLLDEKEETHA
jgi:hypothetical protein